MTFIKTVTPKRKSNVLSKHTPKINDSLVCSECGVKYKAWISLSRHAEIRHIDVINFPCKECGKLFARRSKIVQSV